MKNQVKRAILVALAGPLLLVACGGGGGDTPSAAANSSSARPRTDAASDTGGTSRQGGSLFSTTDGNGRDLITTTTTEPPTTTTTTAPPPTTTTAAPTTTTRGTAPSTAVLTTFQSPSHNIACYLNEGGARCDIAQKSWTPPPKPASCQVDWGQGLEVTSDRQAIVCAGDSTFDASLPVLAYGSASRAGDFVCSSDQTGMTCVHEPTGHGFFLSRERYRLF